EQDHPPLGQARHPSKRTAGPTDRFHLHLRCSLPEGGQGCSPDHAGLQHRGDELARRRDRRNRRARYPRHPPGRSSRRTCPPASSCRLISPSFCCRRSAQSSTRSTTSGSSCATTGSPTASSNPTTISSTNVVRHGTSSSISLGASCPSDCA